MYSHRSTHLVFISNTTWSNHNILQSYIFLCILKHKATESALICSAFPEQFIQSYTCVSPSNNKGKIHDRTTKKKFGIEYTVFKIRLAGALGLF